MYSTELQNFYRKSFLINVFYFFKKKELKINEWQIYIIKSLFIDYKIDDRIDLQYSILFRNNENIYIINKLMILEFALKISR